MSTHTHTERFPPIKKCLLKKVRINPWILGKDPNPQEQTPQDFCPHQCKQNKTCAFFFCQRALDSIHLRCSQCCPLVKRISSMCFKICFESFSSLPLRGSKRPLNWSAKQGGACSLHGMYRSVPVGVEVQAKFFNQTQCAETQSMP